MNTFNILVCPPCEAAKAAVEDLATQALGLGMILITIFIILFVVMRLLRFAFSVKRPTPAVTQVQVSQDIQQLERQREFSWRSRQRDTRTNETFTSGRWETPPPDNTPRPVVVAQNESSIWAGAIARAEAREAARSERVEYDSHGDAMKVVRARGRR